MIIDNLFENNKKQGVAESQLDEVNPQNFDSDEDYYAALNAPAKPRYRGQQSPGVNPDDEDYFREIFRKKRLAKQKAEREADHDRLATGTNEDQLDEFAPSDNGGSRKFIPWPEFIDAVKQIVGKDFSVTEKVVKSTIQDRFIPHDPMEYGPTMLYSYYEARAGRGKGAVSTRGSIQVGKYYPNNTALGKQNFITQFSLLKGHPFERHFDLTFDNIYKIANIIQGNTEGAFQMQPQQGVAESQLDELNFGKTKQFFNRVGQASRAFADNFKASGAAAPAPAGRTGSVSGSINPATNAPWTYDELIASRNARLSATQPATEPEDSSTAGWDDPKSSKYVGRREVARRKAAQTVAPAPTQPNYAGPRGYAKTTMNAPTGAQAFKQAVPAVPAVPTALKTTVTPQLSKDEYIRRIGADAQPVAETVKQIKRMMETVTTKADVQRVKDYIDYHMGTDLTEGAKLKRNRLLSEVTQLAAVRRREIARQTAK